VLFIAENNTGKTILALDLGSEMGYAAACANGRQFSGLRHIGAAAEGFKGRRWAELRRNLTSIQSDAGGIDIIAYERGSFFKSIAAGADYFGLVATLQLWAWENEIAIKPASPGSVKKHVTGGGRAKKEAVIFAVRQAGFDPSGSDEADAIALRDFVLSVLNQPVNEVA